VQSNEADLEQPYRCATLRIGRGEPVTDRTIVGTVETGGGVAHTNQRQPDAKAISRSSPDALEPPVWSQDEERELVPVAGDAEWAMPNARG
jgi:hypothetical protein